MARRSFVRRPSGNYAIVYYVGGRQKWETIGSSRRDAERALTARKREVDTGTWCEPSSETLASYAERWLAHRDPARVGGGGRTRLSPSTFEGYRLNVRPHVLPRLGNRPLSSLRTVDVDRLIAELEADGKARGTVTNAIVPLRMMLADAVRQGLLIANPGARADLPPAQDFAGKEMPPSTRKRSGERCSSSRRSIRSAASPISSSSASSTSRSEPGSDSASSARSDGGTSTASGG